MELDDLILTPRNGKPLTLGDSVEPMLLDNFIEHPHEDLRSGPELSGPLAALDTDDFEIGTDWSGWYFARVVPFETLLGSEVLGNALDHVRVTLQELKLSGLFNALEALTPLSAPSQEPVTDPTDPAAAATDAW